MPEKILTWENDFTSDKWELKADGVLVGYYEPAQNAHTLYDVHDRFDKAVRHLVDEAEARKHLYEMAVK